MSSIRRLQSTLLCSCFLLICAICLVRCVEGNESTEIKLEEQQSAPEIHPVGDHGHHDHHHDHHDHGNKETAFCQGMSMTMFMDGFRWSLFRRATGNGSSSSDDTNRTTDDTPSCLSYYVSNWQLVDADKFRGAMVFSFLLAFLTEGLSSARIRIIPYLQYLDGPRRKLILTMSYGLQQWLGTMIMLVSMTYSFELLVSVVAGLMAGHFWFYCSDHTKNNDNLLCVNSNRPTPRGPAPLPSRNSPYYNPPVVRSTSGRSSLTAAISRRISAAAAAAAGADAEERQSLLMGGVSLSPSTSRIEDDAPGLQLQTRKED